MLGMDEGDEEQEEEQASKYQRVQVRGLASPRAAAESVYQGSWMVLGSSNPGFLAVLLAHLVLGRSVMSGCPVHTLVFHASVRRLWCCGVLRTI